MDDGCGDADCGDDSGDANDDDELSGNGGGGFTVGVSVEDVCDMRVVCNEERGNWDATWLDDNAGCGFSVFAGPEAGASSVVGTVGTVVGVCSRVGGM